MKQWTIGAAAAVVAAGILAGCSSNKGSGPFTDVVRGDQQRIAQGAPTTRAVTGQPEAAKPVAAAPAGSAGGATPVAPAVTVSDATNPAVPPAKPAEAEKPTEPAEPTHAAEPATSAVTVSEPGVPAKPVVVAPVSAAPVTEPAVQIARGEPIETLESGSSASPQTRPGMMPLMIAVDDQGNLSRGFAPSVSYRPSGNVVAGPLYWSNTYRTIKRGDITNAVMEPLEFLADDLLMPIRAIITPPWKNVVYDAVPKDNTTPSSETQHQPTTVEHVVK